ncbi:MAG: enoyl-CoA hydratase-related protein [Burkholderiaceae bacterium]
MQLENMTLDVADHVATVTLNRPDRKNAWNPDMEAEFRRAMEACAADPDVRVIVFTGAGTTFCVGADVQRLSAAARQAEPARPAQPAGQGDFEQRYSWLLAIDKPLIAGINGAVAGVGLCLTLFFDIRYMADGARLATSFARRGLIAEHGSAWLLPRLIGPMNAADLLLTGRTIDAREAEQLGLVRVLDSSDFQHQVGRRARELAHLSSPRSTRLIKQQLRNARHESLAAAIRFADAETARCRDSLDFKEGVASFQQKRPPRFTGQ